VPIVRLDAHQLRARVALACAFAGIQRERSLRTASGDARALAREKRRDAQAASAVIRAALATAAADFTRADELLAEGIRAFTDAGMVLQAWQARYRRAEMRGSEDALEAREALRRCGITDVDRWLALQLPGFSPRQDTSVTER
jgi:hypothetical protein